MNTKKYKVVQDPVYGFKRLDPIPENHILKEFYQSKYYDLIRKGGRAPEISRLMAGGEEAEKERSWLQTTLYSDIAKILGQYSPGKRVLDVGCGTGDLLSFLAENDFNAEGIEPSSEAAAIAGERGLPVYNNTLETFVEDFNQKKIETFDAVILINVLEHVPNPQGVIGLIKELLKPGSLLCIRVPNDFNELQLSAREQLNSEQWWVAPPDHINYFDFQSLSELLERFEFEIVYTQGDFPMELFLLMGDNYIGNPEVGNECHQKRVKFETSIPGELRRRIYRSFAGVGLGRDCFVFGKLKHI